MKALYGTATDTSDKNRILHYTEHIMTAFVCDAGNYIRQFFFSLPSYVSSLLISRLTSFHLYLLVTPPFSFFASDYYSPCSCFPFFLLYALLQFSCSKRFNDNYSCEEQAGKAVRDQTRCEIGR
jgi:hypothetical protein